jgi:molybdopterin-containing oxidoreductase family iron-sulfur binding subunit
MANTKKYWKGFDELVDSPIAQQMAQNEFPEPLPSTEFLGNQNNLDETSTTRRDFLKFLGFSTAAATLAACEAPVVESIPYVVKPEEIVPGIPNYYATTYFDGTDFASILVKSREGRPIKIEPNKEASFNGVTSARAQASVLSLYDGERLRAPKANGSDIAWSAIIKDTLKEIEKANASGKQVVLLTGTVLSPVVKVLVAEMLIKYPQFRHVTFNPLSKSGKLDFHEKLTGERSFPTYDMSKSKLTVGFNADFLGEFIGQDFSVSYAKSKSPGKDMAKHIQFESLLSLTGSNADKRYKMRMSEQTAALGYLYAKLGGNITVPKIRTDLADAIDKVAKELSNNKAQSLVLAGGGDEASEALAYAINDILQNVGATVNNETRSYLAGANDADFLNFIKDAKSGQVGVLINAGVNPAHDAPNAIGFAASLEKITTKISLTDRLDETASLCNFNMPISHFLESWDLYAATSNVITVGQPIISKLFDSMQLAEVLNAWLGKDLSAYEAVKNTYASLNTDRSFNQAFHDGFAIVQSNSLDIREVDLSQYNSALNVKELGGLELVFYASNALGTGSQNNNPWLQELPDPITRVSWDNYLLVGPAKAMELGLEMYTESNGAVNGDLVNISVNGVILENVPVFVQPGLASETLGLAVGYGRTSSGKAGNKVGVNAGALMAFGSDYVGGAQLTKTGEKHPFACIQLAHTMMGRKIVNETTLEEFLNDNPQSWNKKTVFETHKGPLSSSEATLWAAHDHETGHMWNMSIDLNSCIGCGACVVACNAENNVPVVGKDEMRRHRDMHWLRIDRYYSSDMTEEIAEDNGVGGIEKFAKMELASDSPEVVFQPVMCQHCNNAPCETVCPVAATVHSAEGLNHMAYNRCIGTRYCANNCPYKVRRFNWFNYGGNSKFTAVNPSQDDFGRMVLNPDVTVRARGVMEKCSLCIQRIQYAKLEAKKEGKMVADGAFTTACAQACGTGALVFGDVNNKESHVTQLKENPRMYHLLEDVGTKPSVFYQTKVRNLS